MARPKWQYALLIVLVILALDLVYQITSHHNTIHPQKKQAPLKRVRLHPSKLPGYMRGSETGHHHHLKHPRLHHNTKLPHEVLPDRRPEISPTAEPAAGAAVAATPAPEKAPAVTTEAQNQVRELPQLGRVKSVRKPPAHHNYNPRLGKHYETPSDKQPPPPHFVHAEDEHLLTRELVAEVAVQNAVTVTWTNKHMIDFAVNWVHHARQAGITNILVGAMDGFTLAYLLEEEIPCFAMKGLEAKQWHERTTQDLGRHDNFHAMGREKINLIHTFCEMGFDLYLSDVDVVFTKDPFPYFAKYPEADILVSSDNLGGTVWDGGLEKPQAAHSALNIGLMFVRSSPRAMAFAEEWQSMLLADPEMWDQNGFNHLVRKNTHTHNQGDCKTAAPKEQRKDCGTVYDSRVFSANNGGAFVGILPVSFFCGGHEYFVDKQPQTQHHEVFAVHATFQFAGIVGKRHRFREAKLWADPPAYYDHPAGFLTYEPNIPPEMLQPFREFTPGPPLTVQNVSIVAAHMALVHFQLVQIRQAVAIAQSLGRVLIVPPVWCGLDRWWAPHGGKTPGTLLDLPYQCPLDHIVNVHNFSPNLEFREHSFLDNPRLPPRVLVGVGHVHVCSDDVAVAGPCPDKATLDLKLEGVLKVPAAERYAKDQLKDMQSHRVLKLSALPKRSFTRFEKDDEDEHYRKWVSAKVADYWCCVMPPGEGLPGDIWYDMWSDEPHGTLDDMGFPRTPNWRMRTGRCKNKDAPHECFYSAPH